MTAADVRRGPLALACLSFALTVSGAAIAALPASPLPAAQASIELPLAAPPRTAAATEPPPDYGVPHPSPVVVSQHWVHEHHLAVTAALKTPAPASPAVTLPTSPGPVSSPAQAAQTTQPAPTPTTATPSPQNGSGSGVGAELLDKALSMTGVPYVYGGDTPSGFDCSGLVYWAALQLGISSMPRDTYEMLAQGVSSGLLVQVAAPEYGDLAFFGSGHVEFYVKPGETFGAQQPGTDVGYHSYGYGYVPTAFYRVT